MRKTILTFLALAISFNSFGQLVEFPDQNLETAICSHLNCTAGELTQLKVSELTFINASNLSISDITGLEYCVNLEGVVLDENEISDIEPLRNCSGLSFLGLCENKISDISPIINLINISALYLNGNPLGNINGIESLINLSTLGLNRTNISDISNIAPLQSLSFFHAADNPINNIDVILDLPVLGNAWFGGTLVRDFDAFMDVQEFNGLTLKLDNWNLYNSTILIQIPELQSRGLIFEGSCVTSDFNITNPQPGAGLQGLSSHQILWEEIGGGARYIDIEFSPDNGTSWELIADSISNYHYYNWTIPNIEAEQAFLKISDAEVPDQVNYTMPGSFSILLLDPGEPITQSHTEWGEMKVGSDYNLQLSISDIEGNQPTVEILEKPEWLSLIEETPSIIQTIAGSGDVNLFNLPVDVTSDLQGNVYIADFYLNKIFKYTNQGELILFAGTEDAGYNGDNIPAISASLNKPYGVEWGPDACLYIADLGNNMIRKISPDGKIHTVAGTGEGGYNGDGINALSASLNKPIGVSFNKTGDLFIADKFNNRIRKISADGIITTVAGTGADEYNGDNIPAIDANINNPTDMVFDASGNLYIAEDKGHRIRKVTDGIITTIAGTGTEGYSGDNALAVNAKIGRPRDLSLDASGNIFIASFSNSCVRKIDIAGIITTLVGTGSFGFSMDGLTGQETTLAGVGGVHFFNGELYIADVYNSRIRKLGTNGIVTTVTGNLSVGYGGDGGLAVQAKLNVPNGMTLDNAGNLYFSDWMNHVIRKIDENGIISTIAGNGSSGYGGDNGPATEAQMYYPQDMAFDSEGNMFVTDYSNNALRKIDPAGIITTIAGNGTEGHSGDGGQASEALLTKPSGIWINGNNEIFFSETGSPYIRKIDKDGIITAIAGTGEYGSSEDGAIAVSSKLENIYIMTGDAEGNIYFCERNSSKVRKIDTNGKIQTIAGNGVRGYSGNGLPGKYASFESPTGICLDTIGNIYVTEDYGNRVRKIDTSGIVSVVAGNTVLGFSGDGGPATSASMNSPWDILWDNNNNQILFTDAYNNHIRAFTEKSVKFSGVPDAIGENAITLRITAGKNTKTWSYTFLVEPGNKPQILTETIADAPEDVAYQAEIKLVDDDSQELQCILLNSPEWISFSQNGNDTLVATLQNDTVLIEISGMPGQLDVGSVNISLEVSDLFNSTQTTYNITVLEVNDPPVASAGSVITNEDESVAVTLEGTDPESPDQLEWTIKILPVNGSLSGTGRFLTYHPNAAYSGPDQFEFCIKDAGEPGLEDCALITIDVISLNDPPVIQPAQTVYTINEDESVDLVIIASDPADGDITPVNVEIISGPFNGTITGDVAGGNFTYTPDVDYSGTDWIEVQGTEATGAGPLSSDAVTVNLIVESQNDLPVAYDDNIALDEDTQLEISLQGTDTEDNILDLSYEIVTSPDNPEVFTISGKRVTYQPGLNRDTDDSFTYRVRDLDGGLSDPATISLNIQPVDDVPQGDSLAVDAQGADPLFIDLSSVISDVETADADLVIEFVLNWEEGDYTGEGRGVNGGAIVSTGTAYQFNYHKNENILTDDYIFYTLSDGVNQSEPIPLYVKGISTKKGGVVSKGSNRIFAVGQKKNTDFGTPVDLLFIGVDITSPYDQLELIMINEPGSGALSDIELVKYSASSPLILYKGTYTAENNQNALDSIQFCMKLGTDSDTAWTYVQVHSKAMAPIIDPVTGKFTPEETELIIRIDYQDIDTDPSLLQWDISFIPESVNMQYSINDAGLYRKNLSILPPENFTGQVYFEIKAIDADMLEDEVSFLLDVTEVNDPPSISSVSDRTMLEDDSLKLGIFVSDIDTPLDQLEYYIEASPAHLHGELVRTDNELKYIPPENLNGDVSIKVKVYDASDIILADSTIFNVHITPVNDIPDNLNIADLNISEDEGEVEISLTLTDADTLDILSISAIVENTNLLPQDSIRISPKDAISGTERTIILNPPANIWGESNIILVVKDNAGKEKVQSFTLSVAPINDAPELSCNESVEFLEDDSFDLYFSVSDIDSDNHTLSLENAPTELNLVIETNRIMIDPDENYFGASSFGLKVEDDSSASDTRIIYVEVKNVNDPPVLNISSPMEVTENDNFYLDIQYFDPDLSDNIVITVPVAPEWLGIFEEETSSTYIQGTPANADVGLDTVVIAITDGNIATPVFQELIIDVLSATLVLKNEFNELKVYPNPAKDRIIFEGSFVKENRIHLQVFDMRGMLVVDEFIESGNNYFRRELNLDSWGKGIFLYRLSGEKHIKSGKIIKN